MMDVLFRVDLSIFKDWLICLLGFEGVFFGLVKNFDANIFFIYCGFG